MTKGIAFAILRHSINYVADTTDYSSWSVVNVTVAKTVSTYVVVVVSCKTEIVPGINLQSHHLHRFYLSIFYKGGKKR